MFADLCGARTKIASSRTADLKAARWSEPLGSAGPLALVPRLHVALNGNGGTGVAAMTTGPGDEGYLPEDTDPMSMGTKVGIVAAVTVVALIGVLGLLAAFAPNSTAGNAGNTATTTTGPSAKQTAAIRVNVRAGEYYFKSAVTTFKVGVRYHFVVRNDGAIAHEFMLVQPIAPGMMSMEDMDKMAMGHIEFADLQAHQSATVDVTFTTPYPAGKIEMACHVGQHYEKGMRLPIVVTS